QPEIAVERRLRQWSALAALCRQAKFETVSGSRLREFLDLVTQSIAADVRPDAAEVAEPSRIGRMCFRQTVAIYSRRDTGPRRGISKQGRLVLFWAAWRFARGTGKVPRVHGLMPETTFEQLEQPAGPMPEESMRLLERYYRVKVESMQF